MVDEETVLEFERIGNQARSLECEQRELGESRRRRRKRFVQLGLWSSVLAALALLAVAVNAAPSWLILVALLAILVSVGALLSVRLGDDEREARHFISARELGLIQETCSFLVAEHEQGRLPQAEFRAQLDHHTRQFGQLSKSLEHPYR